MTYLERQPAYPLANFIASLWHSSSSSPQHRRERILPSGCVEVILNLNRDYLLDCPEGSPARRSAPSLVVGSRSIYETIDTADMASLIGIHFKPAGFAPFFTERADQFRNLSLPLEALWGASAGRLRDDLRAVASPMGRLDFLERYLLTRAAAARPHHAMVQYALGRIGQGCSMARVSDLAKATGWSERRFSQVFREEVGFSPKAWCRIQRFQRVVRHLHNGADIRWSELALDCGYYDQSHFANEFRAFSGVDATTYSARRTQFANHIHMA